MFDQSESLKNSKILNHIVVFSLKIDIIVEAIIKYQFIILLGALS